MHSWRLGVNVALMACDLGLVACPHSFHSVERAFNVRNLIKTKARNRLGSKNLNAMLQIALEGPDEGVHDIIGDVIPLWKKDSKYRFMYANPSSCLNSPNTVSVSDVSCFLGAIDTNGSGTQIS